MKYFLALLVSCFSASATTYYVSNTGSDAANGTSTGTPWQTISKVNGSAFSPGDSILFKRGDTWAEMLLPPSSGTAGSPITFADYSTGNLPIIDGGGVRTFCVEVTKSNLVFNSFRFTHATTAGIDAGTLNISVLNCTGDLCYTPISSSGVLSSLTVSNCILTGATNEAIGLHGVTHVTVRNCTITNNNQGINNSTSAGSTLDVADCYFSNPTDDLYCDVNLTTVATRLYFKVTSTADHICLLNGGDALSYSVFDLSALSDTSSKSIILLQGTGTLTVNNISVWGGMAQTAGQIVANTGCTYNITNSIFQNVWRLGFVDTGGAINMNHCLMNGTTISNATQTAFVSTGSPQFVSPATGDFRLQAISPAIFTGANIGLTTDIAGHLVHNPPSLGAYEYIPPVAFRFTTLRAGNVKVVNQ